MRANRSPESADERATRRAKRLGRVRRGAYLLPSLFTIGNIMLGFYALVLGMRSAGMLPPEAPAASLHELHMGFQRAAALVFGAAILDALDGRIARLTHTESEFGREYDSLADVFTFGVVPALLCFFWGLHEWGRIGWLVPFFYLVSTATRLARFNVQTKVVDARYFVGLPAPAAAGTICSILFFSPDSEWREWMQFLMLVALVVIGLLMVSTFRYLSGKKLDLERRLSFRLLVPFAALILIITWHWQATALALTLLFTLSGPVWALVSRLRGRRGKPEAPTPAVLSGEP